MGFMFIQAGKGLEVVVPLFQKVEESTASDRLN